MMVQTKKNIGTMMIIPAFCCFGIVDECMFRCQMCFKWKEDQKVIDHKEVPFEKWAQAICALKKIVPRPNEFVINFGGGEALLRKDLLELVRIANAEGFITNIATNGWLIDDECARAIAASGLRSINISLDSLDPGIHDELRGMPGATERVFRAIKNLRAHSKELEIGICSVFYERNLSQMLPLTKWVQANPDINWIVFMAAMQPNNTTVETNWFKGEYSYLWPQSRLRVAALITYLKWLKWWGWKIQNPYAQLDAFIRYFWDPLRFVKSAPCNMDRAIHISATGDIFLCFRHEKIGSLYNDDLADVWHSEIANSARENIHTCRDNCHFLLNCFFEKDYPFAWIQQ
jgi:MoaA/NifB/PqqE/SkfB family radical SAM enzyme